MYLSPLAVGYIRGSYPRQQGVLSSDIHARKHSGGFNTPFLGQPEVSAKFRAGAVVGC